MHKTIGILGGMSPESTVEYYQYITRTYTERFGDYGYPEIIIYSVSFQPYVDWPEQDRWDLVAQGLSEAAQRLEAAGADFIVIATNTMHLVFDQVQASVNVPMLSLLDAVGEAILGLRSGDLAQRMNTVGLLGTKFTMEKTFYQDALARKGITVLVPDADDREYVNSVPIRRRYLRPILDRVGIQPGERVLELGPGPGTLTVEAARGARRGAGGRGHPAQDDRPDGETGPAGRTVNFRKSADVAC